MSYTRCKARQYATRLDLSHFLAVAQLVSAVVYMCPHSQRGFVCPSVCLSTCVCMCVRVCAWRVLVIRWMEPVDGRSAVQFSSVLFWNKQTNRCKQTEKNERVVILRRNCSATSRRAIKPLVGNCNMLSQIKPVQYGPINKVKTYMHDVWAATTLGRGKCLSQQITRRQELSTIQRQGE